MLLPLASQHDVCVLLIPKVGQHVVAGTALAWMLRPSPEDPLPSLAIFERALDEMVRIGFERTLEQDAAFGIRQLVDMACKALSPGVNDPYTAVQAVDDSPSSSARSLHARLTMTSPSTQLDERR